MEPFEVLFAFKYSTIYQENIVMKFEEHIDELGE